MTNRIIVNGAQGKMGAMACQTIANDPQLELVAQNGHGDDLAATIKATDANIVIDFTNSDVVYENTKTIIENNAHPIIGSSGLLTEQVTELQQLAQEKNLGGIIAPNFSIGAILMMKYAAEAASYFQHIEIIEYHHEKKLDAPSGTAVKTAEMIAEAGFQAAPLGEQRELIDGARGANHHNVPIHSVRMPGLMAHQEVIFGGVGETLTIRHDSINRDCFMPGVLLACRTVGHLDRLIYGLEKLLAKV